MPIAQFSGTLSLAVSRLLKSPPINNLAGNNACVSVSHLTSIKQLNRSFEIWCIKIYVYSERNNTEQEVHVISVKRRDICLDVTRFIPEEGTATIIAALVFFISNLRHQ